MPSDKTSLEVCDVTRIRVTGDHQIAVRFRDGLIAELNMSAWLTTQKGPMVEPLHSSAFFADVDIYDGVLIWPNGYDLDPITLRAWAEQGYCG
jgi:hypothetical protein